MTKAETPVSQGLGRRRKLGLASLGLLAALVSAEVCVRVAARVRGRPYSAAGNQEEMRLFYAKMTASRLQGQTREEENPEAPSQGVALHPYLGFDWAENLEQIGREVAYFQGEESKTTCDVLVVGGSVAGSFGNRGALKLTELLAEDPHFGERPVRVLAHGRGGFKQPQQLLLVGYLLTLGYQPDFVVNIDGFNECALANANVALGVHPANPSSSHWAHLASDPHIDRTAMDLLLDMRAKQRRAAELLGFADAWHVHSSAILGGLALRRLNSLRKEFIALLPRYTNHLIANPSVMVAGPPFPAEEGPARELILRTWLESSRSLDALCRSRSIRYAHVLQPTLNDRGSKPLTEEELRSGAAMTTWKAGVEFGYPRMRTLGAELRSLGVAFFDASYAFESVTETLYYDTCHFDQRGIEILAQYVAAAILALERAGR